MQSVVEVVCVGGNTSNKTFNSTYSDPGLCKMVIVQDDEKFPSPRLCLLRRWPNFDGGFGFNLYEDLISSGALKVAEVVRNSPAEAGGLRKNDVIIEINSTNIECKSFFRLVEILKEACSQNEMELLVLAERDAEWYSSRKIFVNSHFPNIEYCETPYYGHLNALNSTRMGASQIEFHSSTGKLYRTTLVIDKLKDSIYRRIEELPSTDDQDEPGSIPPLRPDGTLRHPGTSEVGRVYYRRDRAISGSAIPTTSGATASEDFADSGHGTLTNRRFTPLSTATNTGANLNNSTLMSPYSTLGKSYGEQAYVDLLHDKWADLMDKYLDDRFRSSSADNNNNNDPDRSEKADRDASSSSAKRNHVIRLNEPSATSTTKRSRCQSPNDGSFSFLYSGRDDLQANNSNTSLKDRQTSPYQHLLSNYHRGSPHTQSHHRYTSPHQNVHSPTSTEQRQKSQPRPETENSSKFYFKKVISVYLFAC
jgi:hypothetical protein